MGLVQGATENAKVVSGLFEHLSERGLDFSQPRLYLIDGSRALGVAIERQAGEAVIDADRDDLSDQNHWSTPQEVDQSWSLISDGCGANFDGWYPSLMSPGAKPGHLNSTGWVFYMKGCEGSDPARTYSTRYFAINSR